MRIFTYGTLKVGGILSHAFDTIRGEVIAATLNNYNLYDLGAFPGILPGDGRVHGEIHTYNEHKEEVLIAMDQIEGYDTNSEGDSLYLRRKVNVITDDNKEVEVYVYIFNQDIETYEADIIEDGIWPV